MENPPHPSILFLLLIFNPYLSLFPCSFFFFFFSTFSLFLLPLLTSSSFFFQSPPQTQKETPQAREQHTTRTNTKQLQSESSNKKSGLHCDTGERQTHAQQSSSVELRAQQLTIVNPFEGQANVLNHFGVALKPIRHDTDRHYVWQSYYSEARVRAFDCGLGCD